jgi:hypothetical protein
MDTMVMCLHAEEVGIVIDALWAYAEQSRHLCADDYTGHLRKITRLEAYIQAGSEAP